MPVDRFFHPSAGHSMKVTGLTDLEFRVWWTYIIAADDFGIMRCSAVTIQAANDALAPQSRKRIDLALQRLIDVGLLLAFDHQERRYVCDPKWQKYQHVEYPKQTINPLPPADTLTQCKSETSELFRQCFGKPSQKFRVKVSENSGAEFGKFSEDSGKFSEDSLSGSRAREEANAKAKSNAKANGQQPPTRFGSGVMAGMLPRDHRAHVFCGRKCVPEFLHAEFLRGLGGDPTAAVKTLMGETGNPNGWYARVDAKLPDGPIGDDPVKFWRAQFAAAFPSGAPVSKTGRSEYAEPWVCPHVDPCSAPSICVNATRLGRPEKQQVSA